MALAAEPEVRHYAEVEFSPPAIIGSNFYIDSTTKLSIATAIFALAGLIAVHAWAAIGCPSFFGTKDDYLNLSASAVSTSVQYVEVRIADLTQVHRFISLNFSLVSNGSTAAHTHGVEAVVRPVTWNDSAIVFDAGEVKRRGFVDFARKKPISSSFELVRQPVTDFNALRVKLTIRTNYTGIRGFKFAWHFMDPDASRYLTTSDLLVSCLVAYMSRIFVGRLKFDGESFTQAFLVIVGLAGIMSSNPIRELVGPTASPGLVIADHVLMALFNAVFRMFIIVELELLRGGYSKPAPILVVVLAVVFGFYATLDAAASYDRRMHIKQSDTDAPVVLSTEWALLLAHLSYHCAAGIVVCSATKVSDGTSTRRLMYIAGCLVGTGISTLMTEGWCVLTNTQMYSVVLPLLQHSMMGTFAAMTLFLFRTGGDRQYQNLAASQGKDGVVCDSDAVAETKEEEEEEDGDS
jgi:hypothetical protein